MKKINVDTLYCNGDSWSCGVELDDTSNSFPNIISKNYNLPIINSAKPGGSNQRILRTSIEDISKLIKQGKKPFVLISWTLTNRFELYDAIKNEYASFTSPDSAADIDLGRLIWSRWSTEKSDIINFLTQVISLQSFLKQNNIPYFMANVFKVVYELLDCEQIELYQSQIDTDFYMYNLPFKSLLTPYINIEWGVSHPLKEGHAIIAKFLIEQINIRYEI